MDRKREPEVVHLGRQIRRERMRQGLSLKEIEQRVGISQTHVSEIERGRTSPTVGALVKIAEALNRPLTHFVDSPPPSAVFGDRTTRRELSLNGGCGRLVSLLDPSSPFDISMSLLILEPGASLGEQDCPAGACEFFAQVLEGQLVFFVAGHDHRLEVGDSIHYRAGVAHAIHNPESRPSRAFLATHPRMRL